MFRLLVLVSLLSTMAFADHYEGDYRSDSFERVVSSYGEQANRKFSITTPIYYVSVEYVWEEVLIPILLCEEITWAGDWKNFYQLGRSFDERAKSLAEAVKGVGDSTAPELVPYLLNKPANWQAFAQIIKFADEQIGHGLAYKVLSEYGKENMINLGYYSEESCSLDWELELNLVPKVFRNYSHDETQKFEIRVTDAPLVYGEKETFRISYDGFDSKVYFSTKYNNYNSMMTIEGDTIVYSLQGNRKQVTPLNQVDLTFDIVDKEAVLTIVDNGYISSRGATTTVVVTLHRSIAFWFDKKIEQYNIEIDQRKSSYGVAVKNLKKGKKYYFTYQIKRHDTFLFNDKLSRKEKTEKVKI